MRGRRVGHGSKTMAKSNTEHDESALGILVRGWTRASSAPALPKDMIAARMAAEHYGAQPSGGTVVAKCEAGRFEPVQPRFRADY